MNNIQLPVMEQQIKDFLQFQDVTWSNNKMAGWDVFDGLNSKILKSSKLYKSRLLRLLWIQLFKQNPFNFRKLFKVPQSTNSKALALYISSLIKLSKKKDVLGIKTNPVILANKLMELNKEGYSGLSFGYNFDWQARAFFVPQEKPNMICSVFAGNAFLDLYEESKEDKWLQNAQSICRFILNDMLLLNEEESVCFKYIPGEPAIVHNVNLLAAAFLSRVYKYDSDVTKLDFAQRAVKYSIRAQDSRGAWVYGTRKHHQWVDNFHTGYNLCAIKQYQDNSRDNQFEDALDIGLAFHLANHFTGSFQPKYTNVNTFPIDIHNYAQAIITLTTFSEMVPEHSAYLNKLFNNLFNEMYSISGKFFYYQKNKFYMNKNNYIRWGQAWMFYAFATWLDFNG